MEETKHPIKSIKTEVAPPFSGQYYVGETIETHEDFIINWPVRFVETLSQSQERHKNLDGRPNALVIVPIVDSLEELGLSLTKIRIKKDKVLVVSDIDEKSNPGLLTAYHETLKLRRAARAGLHLASKEATL